ncbi:MAG: sulfur carrier protein ThiS [Thermaceae bacterium]|nr:sulfur carrier protein ThiS [Thermaceae bacterium]
MQLLQLDATHLGIAVAVNRRVIPRSEWAATSLQEGDTIELVYARQGG